jgi:hypothetical protein
VFCVHRLLHLRWNSCFAMLRTSDCGSIDGPETQQMPEAIAIRGTLCAKTPDHPGTGTMKVAASHPVVEHL